MDLLLDGGGERSGLGRRGFLGAATAWPALAAAGVSPGRARAETALATDPSNDTPSLVVAGPALSEAAAWARSLRPALSGALLPAGLLRLRFWGGRDGVTGLNQFEARVLPGGQDALIYPGSAFMAWLIGDSRVVFDGGHLLPLLARVGPGVLMLRGALHGRRAPIRVSVTADQALAGFLGLDLLQVAAEPVAAPAAEAVFGHAVDAVFLHGADVRQRSQVLVEAGLSPAFAVGSRNDQGVLRRDPDFSAVPTLPELLGGRARAHLGAMWSAVAAASVLDVALALPSLSSAAAVARWRRACDVAEAEDQAGDASRGLRVLSGVQAADAAAAMQPDGAAQVELRRWAASRLQTLPG